MRSTLSSEPGWLHQLLEAERDESEVKLEEVIESTRAEIESVISELESLRIQNELSEKENEDLRAESSAYLDEMRAYKDTIKHQSKGVKEFKIIWPLLGKITKEQGLNDIDELVNFLAAEFWPNEDFDEFDVATKSNDDLDSVLDVVEHVKMTKSGNFVMLRSASKSAKESNFREQLRVMEAFEMLESILPIVRERKKDGKSLDFRTLGRKHGFDIANRENNSTMARYGEHRKFEFNGEHIVMQAHLKIGVGAPDKCLRIHFYFHEGEDKFLIGHCGKHLPT
jgi:hypothetical protein